jgi:hypothetical protein
LDPADISGLFVSERDAQLAATKARRTLLSMIGFLSWFTSLLQLRETKLSTGDQMYLQQLRLEERPKVGAVFDLIRNIHEINFVHWANNNIGFHYIWTEKEAKNSRLLRFSPKYYEEVSRLRDAAKGGEGAVEDLPSYGEWHNALRDSDWWGQNLRAGKMGTVQEGQFQLTMKYQIVDRHLYGVRSLVNWNVI